MASTPLLIVDDEIGILEGLGEFLEDEGYEVHQATTGTEGLSLFRSVGPHIVMADLRMEGMSGLDMVREIRKLNELIPIIVITGYGNFGSALEAIRLAVFDYIMKPVDLDRLRETLDRARESLLRARAIQDEMSHLREQIDQLQASWKDRSTMLLEVEPLVETGRLLAGILHNLSNPLTYIMGQAELLQIHHPEIKSIGVIGTQARRMRDIMATVMKKVAASQTRHPEWLQLNDVLQEEVRFLESHPYFKAQVEKEWDLEAELPLFKGTMAELSQVFGNILRNAVEAMKTSQVKRITLRTWHDDQWIHIRVEDTGHGIEHAHLRRIFEPFFTTKTSEVGLSGCVGMGIGLYHCREIVRQYGGNIDVDILPECGTAFTVRLPLSPEAPYLVSRESQRDNRPSREACDMRG